LKNGDGIAELQAVFADRPDLVFRHFADSRVEYMRWQAGRDVCDVIKLANGTGLFIERFELLAWAETVEGLMDKLADC
jgi:hypothetical protein